MVKIKLLIFTAIVAMSALLFSCTDSFEDFNKNKIGVTQDQLTSDYNHIGAFFPQIQQMIYMNYNWGIGKDWTYQIAQNLNADIYSGYMMSPTPFNGNVNNITYNMMAGWNFSAWEYTYAQMMPPISKVNKLTADEYQHFGAVANILKVTGMHRIMNVYGPIIYTQYGKSLTGGVYDSQETTYNAFFSELDNAVKTLNQFVTENEDSKPFQKFDMIFNGDYTKWIQFANSLRLRLAIHIANVSPEEAKKQAEAAVNAPFGVLTEGVVAVSGRGYTHPLDALSNSWEDILMGGAIESIMTGYDDPRLSQYFVPATDEDVLNSGFVYKGIRQGIPITEKATYQRHSKLNVSPSTPAILMSSAEVFFLRSEGALRGWNMDGTAQGLYEDGIKNSMNQWGANIGDYLSNDNVAAPFVDPLNPDNNMDAVNTVSPKWDEAASDEVKQQKISTQKWLAIFPEGVEGWTEVRRTGYPKLLPIVVNNSGGLISTELGVRRLPYPDSERELNTAGYSKAVEYLGGADNGATRLWWDVK